MDDERGAPSNVRGWLSEVYLPALVSSQAPHLMRRLGGRATVDDPFFGRSQGAPALPSYLERAAAWLTHRQASCDTLAFTTGSDRDVTEGTLGLTVEGKRVSLPVAVVAERRAEREVEIRVYCSTKAVFGVHKGRAPLVPEDRELAVPPPVAAHLQALDRGDLDAVVASFEDRGTLRDPAGSVHAKDSGGGALRVFYEKLFSSVGRPGVDLIMGARADDGRTCALEFTSDPGSERGGPQPGLAVYERGESGLLRAARLYYDF